MKRQIVTCLGLLLTAPTLAQDFYEYWGDGRAEISSYRIVQPRYGQERVGQGVLIFVTEDINRTTKIKVESPTPAQDRIYTLKLNNVLKFTTGVYDYSVMTSVFSAVEPREGDHPFELLKLNLTAQEWCGHVFEEVRIADGEVDGYLNSYFEREGRQEWSFDQPDDFESEDHLLIRIRELKGQWLAEGETRELTLLPSLWQFRMRHQERTLVQATVHKGTRKSITIQDVAHDAVPWSWSYGAWTATVHVEAAYPHRILRWKTSDGGSGELLESQRMPYWGQNSLAHEGLREELRIR